MPYKQPPTIIIPREGVKTCCPSPIWRFINGEWVCLNCPLSDAIRNHDDDARERIGKLADSTKQSSIQAWLEEQQEYAWTGGAR